MFPSANEQMDVIRAGAVDLLPEDELVRKIEVSIKKNKPLNIKFGADPSRPDLHIGHAVVLQKIRQFQDLGHKAILIIGDFTAMIGDPTGKSKTRPQLTIEETKINGQSYVDQATIVLSEERLDIRYNSDWLGKMNFSEVIRLASCYTVAQLLERDDFKKRYTGGVPISVHEFLYPLAQAMDSVEIDSDVELGGSDQKFNLLVGREVQKAYGKEAQVILTLPILEGTDGVQKMSKSLDNYIALTDTPSEMFGKAMSIPDELIPRYLQYGSYQPADYIEKVAAGLKDGSMHPRAAKVDCAKKIVALYHGEEAADNAFAEFERIFVKKDIPDEIDELLIDTEGGKRILGEIISDAKMAPSKKEARRLIQAGAVSIDGEKAEDYFSEIDLTDFRVFKVGKRKFLRIKTK